MGAELLAFGAQRIEPLEDAIQLAGRNPGAVILDRDHRLVGIEAEGKSDTPAGRAEGFRVGQQVAHDLDEAVLEGGHHRLLVAERELEARRAGAPGVDRGVDLGQRTQ